MKKLFIPLFVLTVLILCAVPVVQSFKLNRQKEQLAAVQEELQAASRQVEQLRAANERLEGQRRQLQRQMRNLQSRSTAAADPMASDSDAAVAPAGASTSETEASEEEGSPMGGFLAEMMEDPDMRKFVRDQQRQMMDPLYQPLIDRLGLTAEEADVFKDFLADTQMSGAEQATAIFAGSTADRAEAMEELSAQQEQHKAEIREFLGEDGYAQYEDYQQTLGERMQLNQFRTQTAGSEHPLTDEQTEWLLTLMKEEKQAAATETGLTMPDGGQDPANLQAMFSGERVEELMQMQETVNQRVCERAEEVLTAEQIEEFSRFQTNQLQMMRMSMSMARKMFGPEAAESGPGSPAQ